MQRRTAVLILVAIVAILGLNVVRLAVARGVPQLVPGTLASVSGPTVPGAPSVLRYEPGAEVVFRFDLYNPGRWPVAVTRIEPAREGFAEAATLDCGGHVPGACELLTKAGLGSRERHLFHVRARFGGCEGREPGEIVPAGDFLVDLSVFGVPVRQAVRVEPTGFLVPDPCG